MTRKTLPQKYKNEEVNFLKAEIPGSKEGDQLMSSSQCNDNNMIWILDSGASVHVINSNVPMKNKTKLDPPIRLSTAKSGSFLEAHFMGDIDLLNDVNGKEKMITVNDVLSVEGLRDNLLSVGKLEANGFRVIFEKGHGYIIRRNQVVAMAIRNRSTIYELRGSRTDHSECKHYKKKHGLNIHFMNFKRNSKITNDKIYKRSRKSRINESTPRRRKKGKKILR